MTAMVVAMVGGARVAYASDCVVSAGVTQDGAFVTGTDGADTINCTGSSQVHLVRGRGGNDTITGGSANDQLYGSDDFDSSNSGDDTINGGPGHDTIQGNDGNDTLSGGDGDDTIFGWTGNDDLFGDGDNDLLVGGAGDDDMAGGAGIDLASYSNDVAVTVDLATGTASGPGNDTLATIENLEGSEFADSLTGDDADNVIDPIAGNDVLVGGLGTDTVAFRFSQSGVRASLATGTARGNGSVSLSGFENLLGSEFNDALTGNSGANVLDGGEGDDRLSGREGNDTLLGDLGIDSANGDGGTDTCDAERERACEN